MEVTDDAAAMFENLRNAGPALPPTFYGLRGVLHGFERDGIVLDRLPATFFFSEPSQRADDLVRHLEPGLPAWEAAALMASIFTRTEVEAVEGYLRRTRPAWMLERVPVTPPVPWCSPDGEPYTPPAWPIRDGDSFQGLLWLDAEYELPFHVALLADACKGIDRATGRAPLRPWRPSDGEIV